MFVLIVYRRKNKQYFLRMRDEEYVIQTNAWRDPQSNFVLRNEGRGGRGNARLAAEACEGDGRRRLRGAVAERRPVTKDTI